MEKPNKDQEFLIQDSTEEFEVTDLETPEEYTPESEDFDDSEPEPDTLIKPHSEDDDEDDDEEDDEDDEKEDDDSEETEDEVSLQYYIDEEPEQKPRGKKDSGGAKILSFEDFVAGMDSN